MSVPRAFHSIYIVLPVRYGLSCYFWKKKKNELLTSPKSTETKLPRFFTCGFRSKSLHSRISTLPENTPSTRQKPNSPPRRTEFPLKSWLHIGRACRLADRSTKDANRATDRPFRVFIFFVQRMVYSTYVNLVSRSGNGIIVSLAAANTHAFPFHAGFQCIKYSVCDDAVCRRRRSITNHVAQRGSFFSSSTFHLSPFHLSLPSVSRSCSFYPGFVNTLAACSR